MIRRWPITCCFILTIGLSLAGCQLVTLPLRARTDKPVEQVEKAADSIIVRRLPVVDLPEAALTAMQSPAADLAANRSTPSAVPVSYQEEIDGMPLPPDAGMPPPPDSEVPANQAEDKQAPEFIQTPPSSSLELREVILSVTKSYPLLVSAYLERQVAEGKELSARGDFDLGVKAFSIAEPEGFYENYRNGIALKKPIFSGGYLYSGYKIGRGDFQPWFKERETNDGGEFAAGFGVPLLKDRTIDKRRSALFQAELARQAVEPQIRSQLIEVVRLAAQSYWIWVAAGRQLEAQRGLLELAQERVKQIQERVNAGDLARVARINNEQLIASRETKLIESQRKLRQSAIKLSLFMRTPAGEPIIPDVSQLPADFPAEASVGRRQLHADISRAVSAQPEIAELDLLAEQVRVELEQAENMLLPKLDAQLLASKDVGGPASSTRDKTPFNLEVGLYGEVPLQRREARGKIESAQGKLSQIQAKRQFVVDKVTARVQNVYAALEAATGRVERAKTNVRLARETLELGRQQFDAGDIELITLNIYEQSAADAQLLLVEAQAELFIAEADYRASLALDPLATVP